MDEETRIQSLEPFDELVALQCFARSVSQLVIQSANADDPFFNSRRLPSLRYHHHLLLFTDSTIYLSLILIPGTHLTMSMSHLPPSPTYPYIQTILGCCGFLVSFPSQSIDFNQAFFPLLLVSITIIIFFFFAIYGEWMGSNLVFIRKSNTCP